MIVCVLGVQKNRCFVVSYAQEALGYLADDGCGVGSLVGQATLGLEH